MATTNYLDLTGLQVYDGLIKTYVTNADAKAIKTVILDGNNIKFYKKENATTSDSADYTVTIPDTDLSNLLEKINGGVTGNVVTIGADGIVVDSGIKAADVATKAEVKAARKGRFQAMREELNSPNTFAILTPEQEKKLEEITTKTPIKEKKDLGGKFREKWQNYT